MQVLFDILRARAGRGDQAEGRGLANTTVLFPQGNAKSRVRLPSVHLYTWLAYLCGFVFMQDEGILLHLRSARITKALALDATEKALFYAANVGNSVC